MNKNSFFSKQNIIVKILLLIMAVWMVWFVGSALVGQVRDLFVQSEELHYVTLERAEAGYGMLAPTEYVFYASLDGAVTPVVGEGERVRKGNAVFQIGEKYQHATNAGRVSYDIDGLENLNDIGVIGTLDFKQKYTEQQKRKSKTEEILSGEPCAKVQDTLGGVALYITVANTEHTAAISIGQTVKVRLVDLDVMISGTVREVLTTADDNRCLKLYIAKTEDALYQQRIYQVELPYNSEKVIAIPKQALVKKQGVEGVYYLHKGFVFWKAVTISERWIDQGVLVVDEGLQAGDILVTTPKLVREGENIKF